MYFPDPTSTPSLLRLTRKKNARNCHAKTNIICWKQKSGRRAPPKENQIRVRLPNIPEYQGITEGKEEKQINGPLKGGQTPTRKCNYIFLTGQEELVSLSRLGGNTYRRYFLRKREKNTYMCIFIYYYFFKYKLLIERERGEAPGPMGPGAPTHHMR